MHSGVLRNMFPNCKQDKKYDDAAVKKYWQMDEFALKKKCHKHYTIIVYKTHLLESKVSWCRHLGIHGLVQFSLQHL